MIQGYKCFHKGLIDNDGCQYEVGKVYHTKEFMEKDHGFHVCTNLEDTLRNFDAMNSEVDIALVNCFGKLNKFNDENYGFYDMYLAENIVIKKVLTREEIINYALNLDPESIKRFLTLFKLTEEEIILFQNKFINYPEVADYILYYQQNDKEAFQRKYEREYK